MLKQRIGSPASCEKRIELNNAFRKLWEEHVMWTRSFIISTAADLGDLPYVTARLLRNPQDFAKEFQKYYGAEHAKKFAQLLTEHLTIAAELVNAAKAENKEAADNARKKWYQNADEIAEFLSSINPYWNKRAWQSMLYNHLKITEQEAALRLSGQYAADVALFDEIETQALDMADFMTLGIMKQYNL